MSAKLYLVPDDLMHTGMARRDAPESTRHDGAHRAPESRLQLVSNAAAAGGSVVSMPAAGEPRPVGSAFVASAERDGGRIYLCDQSSHAINVLDQHCRPLFSFGGPGTSLGQFDTPTDVVVVRLETGDPDTDTELLVVADKGNHRLQLFELDGAVIGEIGGPSGRWTPGRFPTLIGSPFFRLGDVAPLPFPSHLEWRAPYLDVVCAGAGIRLDLAAVLLPDFATWITDASPVDLRLAFLLFATDPNRAEIPESCLQEIAERLQPAWRRSAAAPPPSPR